MSTNDTIYKVFDGIVDYYTKHGYPPTIREMQEHFGFASPRAISYHATRLVKMGWLLGTEDGEGRSRAPLMPRNWKAIWQKEVNRKRK